MSTEYEWGSFSLDGKVAVVTGGGSGIGKAICELFAKKGAMVEILDLDLKKAEEVVKGIAESNSKGSAHASQMDVTDEKQVSEVFAEIAKRKGTIDILVNNAGVSTIGTVEQATQKDMEFVLNVNVKGVFYCCKAVAPIMVKGGGGAVVNMGSIASVIGLRDRFTYSASKGAVLTMTLSMANDYVKQGIRVNAVCPARIHTPFVDGYLKKHYPGKEKEMFENLSKYQPMGRMGQPKEVAALVLYLASREAAFVTGAEYRIDGGVTGLT
eukprot:jgi/Bigna1/47937/estExt_Genewise1.C_200063